MPGPVVSVGASVLLSPGAAGPPDSGVITTILQSVALAAGLPLAVTGSLCTMVNSVSGVPYTLPIGSVGASAGVSITGQALVRVGDRIPSGPGMLTILGPPSAPFVVDQWSP
jgi:hypothetical protein